MYRLLFSSLSLFLAWNSQKVAKRSGAIRNNRCPLLDSFSPNKKSMEYIILKIIWFILH